MNNAPVPTEQEVKLDPEPVRQLNNRPSLSSPQRSHCIDYAITNQCGRPHDIRLNGRNTSRPVIQSKVKLSFYMLGQALRVPQDWGSQISRRSSHEGSKVVSPAHPATFIPQGIFLVLISLRGWVNPRAIVRPEGLYQWKLQWHHRESKRQCLNQLCHRVTL